MFNRFYFIFHRGFFGNNTRNILYGRTMSHHGSDKPNRLIKEKSPYLLQHAYNLVDWYPWSSEAFKAAQEQDKPIFLSVGYSTCHWCHVMERESFVDTEIAKLMNENFINIKVDREERPDVDRLYMTFVTSITGHGGWPMSVFLTPIGEPLTGGTYFPPEDHGFAGLGFKSVLKLVADQWKSNNASVRAQGKALSDAIKKEVTSKVAGEAPDPEQMLKGCFNHLQEKFDKNYGGFGSGPKFPKPVDWEFVLYCHKKSKDPEVKTFALEALDKTLDEINRGGIHDHLGKGFHRYAVDGQWRVPHFEKMLYDQAQLLSLYSNYYKETGKFSNVIEDIVDYVKENLTHQLGGFFCGEDAESLPNSSAPKKKEGAFYVWNMDELKKLLTDEQLKVFKLYYNVQEQGNCPFDTDPRGELKKENVLYVGRRSIDTLAEECGVTKEKFEEVLQQSKQILINKQKERPRPSLDTKILTCWNGLMISGLCTAYSAFPEKKEYLQMAEKSAEFLAKYLIDKNGKLLRAVYSDDGKSNVHQIYNPIFAFADDFAFYIQALLDLYEVDFDERHLRLAYELQNQMDNLLYDSDNRTGYYTNQAGDVTIFARMQEDQDGVEPCANSIAALNSLRLNDLLGKKEYKKAAGDIFNGHAANLKKFSFSLPKMVLAANRFKNSAVQIVVVAFSLESAKPIIDEIQKRYIPDKTLIFLATDYTPDVSFLLSNNDSYLQDIVKSPLKNDQPTVYICENFSCSLPITDFDNLKSRLDHI